MDIDPRPIQEKLKHAIPPIHHAIGRYGEAVAGLNAALAGLQSEDIDEATEALIFAVQVAYGSHLQTFHAALAEHLAALGELRQACADADIQGVLKQHIAADPAPPTTPLPGDH